MLQDLKDLQHLLKLCRKYGVTDIDLGTTKIKLGDIPSRQETDDEVTAPYDQDRVILEQLGIV